MRWPPENRNAAVAGRGVGRDRLRTFRDHLDSQSLASLQEPIFTAVPSGRYWQVKAMAPDGDVARLGNFRDRLTALGGAVLLSAQAGGTVVP
jgi:hypothetical protein